VTKARFVDQAPRDEFWQLLHQLADQATPAMLRDLTALLGSVGASLSRERLADLLSAGNLAAVEAELHRTWEQVGRQGLQDQLLPRLRALALDAAQATALAEVSVAFNVQDTQALRAIDAYAGQQITAISATTREAVQGIVRRAFESGTPITQQIGEIEALVGLTPRQAEALGRFRQGLLDEGRNLAQVQRLVEQKAAAMRRLRAEAIARTESINSVSLGAHERTLQAIRSGLLDEARVRRYWVPALDERTCQICSTIPARNPQGRGAQEPFDTSIGPVMFPTIHPMCRCTISLKIGDLV
jgi:hypothetical protein